MVDLIAFISVESVSISFMNADNVITLTIADKSPAAFSREAHQLIHNTFQSIHISLHEEKRSALAAVTHSKGETPTLHALQKSLEEATAFNCPTAHYLITDGLPTDCSISELKHLISERQCPERNPITFLSCTNADEECSWMKEVSEKVTVGSDVLLL